MIRSRWYCTCRAVAAKTSGHVRNGRKCGNYLKSIGKHAKSSKIKTTILEEGLLMTLMKVLVVFVSLAILIANLLVL